ncbi:16446_t:CDS:2, partial [Funneliformis caledonium]
IGDGVFVGIDGGGIPVGIGEGKISVDIIQKILVKESNYGKSKTENKRILLTVNHIQREVASDQLNIKLDTEFEEIDELLEILPNVATLFLNDIDDYTKELEELPIEKFLDDKQIIKYVAKDSYEENITDSKFKPEIISINEAAQS